jgi:hypothetical protein
VGSSVSGRLLENSAMKLKLDRVISIATLVAACVAIVLALKKPAPVAQPQAPTPVAAHTGTSDQETSQSEQETRQSPASGSYESPKSGAGQAAVQTPSPVSSSVSAQATPQAVQQNGGATSAKPNANINSEAISAMLAKTLGSAGAASLTPDSNVGSGEPNIKDQQVTMEGDIVHGRFLTEIAGKDVWVTISGHMGEKDGYATFDPTEFKVGDMEVPVELVNPALQKKLAEERDRLKIPNGAQ